MENQNFNSFNSEIAYVVALQVADKVLKKEVTQEEMNVIMNNMLDKEMDFIYFSGTFVNKKCTYFLEFQPIVNMKKAEEKQ